MYLEHMNIPDLDFMFSFRATWLVLVNLKRGKPYEKLDTLVNGRIKVSQLVTLVNGCKRERYHLTAFNLMGGGSL